MARAYLSTAFTMPNIAHAFDVSVQTVSRAVRIWEGQIVRHRQVVELLLRSFGAEAMKKIFGVATREPLYEHSTYSPRLLAGSDVQAYQAEQ